MKDYKKYNVWIIGHEVTMDIYNLTQSFPADEKFEITNQMRRASSSIPANIAEGCGRESDAEFRRFLIISQGSASELAYFTILAKDLKYIKNDDFLIIHDKANKIKRSLNNLIQKL
ncbi:four helix bundle protein [Maribacter sp. R77961]|uniref:four helix bundle protein n=1 Tax=Maribacter sp. R77961 TaxID=3093871 RepID=UPI0037C729DC